MSRVLRSRAQQVAASIVFVALLLVGFLPLFGGPGYEQSLASGLLIPSAAAIATAFDLGSSAPSTPAACVRRGLISGALLSAVAFLTACLHGVRVGFCDFSGGSTFFLLTAGFGALVGGVWGAVTAEIFRLVAPQSTGSSLRSVALRIALAIAAPLAGIGISIVRFWASPMIFAYDPFFGYFSGTLYDTTVDTRPELWTYRAGSMATLVGAVFVSAAMTRSQRGRVMLRSLRGSPQAVGCLALGLVAWLISVAITTNGATLGHYQTALTIERALGGHASGPRCDIFHPDSVSPKDAATMVLDCEQELAAVERRLETRLEGRLAIFEFADADQKRRLMGAAETSIAKPWRREAYVQVSQYPHLVLGHEIAHVVASGFASGPFRVGGGTWPDPGLIEGLAVATVPEDEELTPAQWARAMLDVGLLPGARQIFSLGFLGQSAEKSYTVAGAFVEWTMERWGLGLVHDWYKGASIEGLTHESWAALDQDFRHWLASQSFPPAAVEYARARFGKASVWKRRCPHVVDAFDGAADRCRDEHRFDAAVRLYDQALDKDPDDWHARFGRSLALLRLRRKEAGLDGLGRIEKSERAPPTWQDRAQEAMADEALLDGRSGDAADAYRRVAARTPNEDFARTLEVKAKAATSLLGRQAIIDVLIGEEGKIADPWLGALSTADWASSTSDPLPEYLLGKNLALRGYWTQATVHLDRALAESGLSEQPLELSSPRIARELLRTLAICACAGGDEPGLSHVRSLTLAPGSPFASTAGGRLDWLLGLVDRCARTESVVAPP